MGFRADSPGTGLPKEQSKASIKASSVSKVEETQPVLLDRQRCTIIEIIKKRFVETAPVIKKHILEANLDFLTLNTLAELVSLFPIKTFMTEFELFSKYDQPADTLSSAEQFLHELFTIPNIRNKLT